MIDVVATVSIVRVTTRSTTIGVAGSVPNTTLCGPVGEVGDVGDAELDHLAVGDDDRLRRLHPGGLLEAEEHRGHLGVLLTGVVEVVVLDDVVRPLAVHEPPLVARRRGGERHHVARPLGRVEQLRPADDDPAARGDDADADPRLVADDRVPTSITRTDWAGTAKP